MIVIHYDFVDGTEVSYEQGRNLKDGFTTNCLSFFNMVEDVDDVVVLKKDGTKISRKNIHNHSSKQIRFEHNIYKMLLADSFDWI